MLAHTVEEIAAMLGAGRSTIYAHLDLKGRLRAMRPPCVSGK